MKIKRQKMKKKKREREKYPPSTPVSSLYFYYSSRIDGNTREDDINSTSRARDLSAGNV